MFALFESLGGIELVIVGIASLLLFGKDLPKVAADAGAQFTKLKRTLDSTWRESGLEKEVRQIRDALPRDLSLTDVARTASEKLAVRLEEEGRARAADPQSGPVARGSTIDAPLPEPVEHGVLPGIDPASEFRATPRGATTTVGAPSESDSGAVDPHAAASAATGAHPPAAERRARVEGSSDDPRPPAAHA